MYYYYLKNIILKHGTEKILKIYVEIKKINKINKIF